MEYFSCKLFILVLVLPIIARCGADSIFQECGKNFSITTNTLLNDNINHTLSGLVEKTSIDGFSTASNGVGTDAVYGLTRCGVFHRRRCSACLLDAANKMRTICPSSAKAQILSEECLLRYDTDNFLGQSDTSNIKVFSTRKKAADTTAFNQTVWTLMEAVRVSAAKGDDKFGRGEINDLKNNLTLYGMAQCTGDLMESECNQCLGKLSLTMERDCENHLGCYVISISCELRYVIKSLLIDDAAPSPNALAPSSP